MVNITSRIGVMPARTQPRSSTTDGGMQQICDELIRENLGDGGIGDGVCESVRCERGNVCLWLQVNPR